MIFECPNPKCDYKHIEEIFLSLFNIHVSIGITIGHSASETMHMIILDYSQWSALCPPVIILLHPWWYLNGVDCDIRHYPMCCVTLRHPISCNDPNPHPSFGEWISMSHDPAPPLKCGWFLVYWHFQKLLRKNGLVLVYLCTYYIYFINSIILLKVGYQLNSQK